MSYADEVLDAGNILVQMLREKEDHEVRIARQKQKVAALAELCHDSEFADQTLDLDLGSISDAVRTVMRSSRKEWLNTSEIKSRLEELGFPIHRYKAPVATIGTVLKRMADDQEVVIEKRGVYSKYKWVGPSARIKGWLDALEKEMKGNPQREK